VSPLMRRPTAKAAIWAGVASPRRISAIAAAASSRKRSAPAHSGARTAGQPPISSSNAKTAGRLRGAAALAQDPAAFPLGRATPDPLALAAGQGELQAWLAHRAAVAHELGRARLFLGQGVEHLGIDAPAGRGLPP